MIILSIMFGGALGALARYGVSLGVGYLSWQGFPWATLLVNTTGSFVIGFVLTTLALKPNFGVFWQSFFIIGFLGAFTTFSTFSLETLRLVTQQQGWLAIANVLANVSLGLLGVLLGAALGKYL